MAPVAVVQAPGRVNLIGGHVDFHDGLVVAAAIDRRITLEVHSTGGPDVQLASDRFESTVMLPAQGTTLVGDVSPPWGRLAAGVLHELDALGRPPVGFSAQISSEVPLGGGLSSSAAFGVAVGLAASLVAVWEPDPAVLAAACQRAEWTASGVACGIQDPLVIALGGVVALDCRTLETEPLRLPEGVGLAVVDSGVSRTLGASPWTARQEESFRQAQQLGVRFLRDAAADGSTTTLPLARHVIDEIGRVRRFVEALRTPDPEAAGALMVQSHASSRDLWKSSIRELDLLVDELVAGGAFGARLTGGGFGGCVVALGPEGMLDEAAARAAAAFAREFGRVPSVEMVSPVAGAGVVTSS